MGIRYIGDRLGKLALTESGIYERDSYVVMQPTLELVSFDEQKITFNMIALLFFLCFVLDSEVYAARSSLCCSDRRWLR